MTIEYRRSTNEIAVVLVECPICGKEFGRDCGNERRWHYINDHTAEDFGLTRVEFPDDVDTTD